LPAARVGADRARLAVKATATIPYLVFMFNLPSFKILTIYNLVYVESFSKVTGKRTGPQP
jgi:hypothetical protein